MHVSNEEARQYSKSKLASLRAAKKLPLVLDIDHTLVHTVDPRAGLPDLQRALAGVLKDIPPAARPEMLQFEVTFTNETKGKDVTTAASPNIVALRPGVRAFLRGLESRYHIMVFSQGVRQYVSAIVDILSANPPTPPNPDDPAPAVPMVTPDDIFARERATDEAGDKSQGRLFPRVGDSEHLAVIVDDRTDVWQGHRNVLKVEPFTMLTPAVMHKFNPAVAAAMFTCRNTHGFSWNDPCHVTPPTPPPCISFWDNKEEADPLDAMFDSSDSEDEEVSTAPSVPSTFTPVPQAHRPALIDLLRHVHGPSPACLAAPDPQLAALTRVLEAVHDEYYTHPTPPPVPDLIAARARAVLAGVKLAVDPALGLPPTSEVHHLTAAFGGVVVDLDDAPTHIIATRGATCTVPGADTVQPAWLYFSCWTWEKMGAEAFTV